MHDSLHIVDVAVRLPSAGTAGSLHYRPLVIGPAWLERPAGTGPWIVRLADSGWLRPATEPQGPGLPAWAILCPEDLAARGIAAPRLRFSAGGAAGSRLGEIEIQGWCLMYAPGSSAVGSYPRGRAARGVAFVDAADGDVRRPAVFELPGELFERLEYLAARGIPARPLALPTACRR